MESVLRVGMALHNAGCPVAARTIWEEAAVTPALLEFTDRLEGELTIVDHTIATTDHRDGTRLTLDGTVIMLDDLSGGDLLVGVDHLASTRGDLEETAIAAIEDVMTDADSPVERDRIRLLLEDYLVDSDARATAAHRLASIAARHRREYRDVSDLFET